MPNLAPSDHVANAPSTKFTDRSLTVPLVDCLYLLDVEIDEKYDRSFVIPRVAAYRVTPIPALDFEWTLGESPIRDHQGVRQTMVALSGRTGVGPVTGRDRTGKSIVTQPGPAFIDDLREFLTSYYEDAQRGRRKREVRLVLRAVAEGDELYVEPMRPEFDRDAQTTRFSWRYALTFRGYGLARHLAVPAVKEPAAKERIEAEQSWLDAAVAFLDGFATTVAVAATAAEVALLAPVFAVDRVVRSVLGVEAAIDQAERVPVDVMHAVIATIGNASAAVFGAYMLIPFVDRPAAARETYFRVRAYLDSMRYAADLVLGQHRIAAALAPAASPPAPASPSTKATLRQVCTTYTVRPGDTLQSIAAKSTGDPTTATEIATLNGMSDFWTLGDGSPLRPGIVLVVPDDRGLALVADASGDVPYSDIYGTDFVLSPAGDIPAVGDDPQQLAVVSGRPLIEQAMRLRLTTIQGEHGVFGAYGITPGPGEVATSGTAGTLAGAVRAQSLRDPRILRVDALSVHEDGDAFAVDVGLRPRSGPRFNVVVPIPTLAVA